MVKKVDNKLLAAVTDATVTSVLPVKRKWIPPAAGIGRVKGVPNKITRQLKDMILGALDESGGVDYLVKQAKEQPVAFMTLVGKVLPMTIAGDANNPLQMSLAVKFIKP